MVCISRPLCGVGEAACLGAHGNSRQAVFRLLSHVRADRRRPNVHAPTNTRTHFSGLGPSRSNPTVFTSPSSREEKTSRNEPAGESQPRFSLRPTPSRLLTAGLAATRRNNPQISARARARSDASHRSTCNRLIRSLCLHHASAPLLFRVLPFPFLLGRLSSRSSVIDPSPGGVVGGGWGGARPASIFRHAAQRHPGI